MFLLTQKAVDTNPSEQIVQDLPEYKELLSKINHQLSTSTVERIEFQYKSESSIAAFFKAKNAWMTEYLLYQNLYLLQRVTDGGELPSKLIEKLLESRLMVSKMSSVQKKLQYQVEKIMQVASNTLVTQNGKTDTIKDDEIEIDEDIDELAYKPKPHLLQSQYGDDGNNGQQRKYIPPKLASTLSKQDQIAETIGRQEERRKQYLKRKLKQTLLEDDNEDAPQTLTTEGYQKRYYGQEEDPAQVERQKFEEENYVRLPKTKADKFREKRREKQLQVEDRMDNLGELSDINNLLRMEGMVQGGVDEDDFKAQNKIRMLKDKQKTLNSGGKKKFHKLQRHK